MLGILEKIKYKAQIYKEAGSKELIMSNDFKRFKRYKLVIA
mgnify:CR=1 FL=1